MASWINLLNENGFSFLTTNMVGLYLPLMISLILSLFFIKDLLKKENIILFVIGLIGCYFLSYGVEKNDYIEINNVMTNLKYNQFHSVNVFGILYLLYYSLPSGKKIKLNFSTLWVYSFISLWIVDGWYAYENFNQNWFSSSIGGAGIFDGLLLTPLVSVLGALLIQYAYNLKQKEKDKINKKI
jgi:uncharacterized membrane protein